MKPPEVLSSTLIHRSRILTLVEDEIKLESGATAKRAVIQHPGAIVILPQLEPDRFLVLHQYRHAVKSAILEFPAGTLGPREAPESCARRELIEETDYKAARWTALGTLYPLPGYCDELQHLFLAQDLTSEKGELDDDEQIEVLTMSTREIQDAIGNGRMNDAKSISLFFRAQLLGLI